MKIVLDIETIPGQSEELKQQFIDDAKANFKVPSSLTKGQAAKDLGLTNEKDYSAAEVKQMWADAKREEEGERVGLEAWKKTALDGAMGEVFSWALCVIGMEDGHCSYRIDGTEEKEMLESLNETLNEILEMPSSDKLYTPFFIGHNIKFDLKFLFQRFVISGIEPVVDLPFNGYHGKDFFDNAEAWAGRREYISQDKLCKALGIEGKPDDIDGSQVWDYVERGEYKKVASYNIDDVKKATEIYKRLTFAC